MNGQTLPRASESPDPEFSSHHIPGASDCPSFLCPALELEPSPRTCQMTGVQTAWICTTSPDGQAHASPVGWRPVGSTATSIWSTGKSDDKHILGKAWHNTSRAHSCLRPLLLLFAFLSRFLLTQTERAPLLGMIGALPPIRDPCHRHGSTRERVVSESCQAFTVLHQGMVPGPQRALADAPTPHTD